MKLTIKTTLLLAGCALASAAYAAEPGNYEAITKEDMAKVASLNESVAVPYGSFNHVLVLARVGFWRYFPVKMRTIKDFI